MSLEWGLHIDVTDKHVSKTIRVSGEMIIGEVILELVSALAGEYRSRTNARYKLMHAYWKTEQRAASEYTVECTLIISLWKGFRRYRH
jgi:hypothetical protein